MNQTENILVQPQFVGFFFSPPFKQNILIQRSFLQTGNFHMAVLQHL